MARALYGPGGFFVRERPADHFRTSAHASPLFAAALARLVCQVDTALGAPATLDLVDVGAGRGELLTALLAELPPPVRARVRPIGVEVTMRSWDGISWRTDLPRGLTGVLLATEWLDNIPLDLARDGRYLDTGLNPGDPLSPADAAWAERWWPAGPDEVIEIGRTRDEAWADAVAAVSAGLALAVDYGHLREHRPPRSTATGFRHGREVPPAFDGSTDITCHVAMDSAAAAAGPDHVLLRQRDALHRLGVDGRRPPLTLASTDPIAYVRALSTAGAGAELTAPAGLGAHWWLAHPVALPHPLPLLP
ncbi:SAM-dependent methyltransferase [Catellatospora sp. NEAU-YM18]|nr:SAM-dependent methyltransferase [Catellatospora tritici]